MVLLYVVLAPENPLVDELTTDENKAAVEEYKEAAKKQSDIERTISYKRKNWCIHWFHNG